MVVTGMAKGGLLPLGSKSKASGTSWTLTEIELGLKVVSRTVAEAERVGRESHCAPPCVVKIRIAAAQDNSHQIVCHTYFRAITGAIGSERSLDDELTSKRRDFGHPGNQGVRDRYATSKAALQPRAAA